MLPQNPRMMERITEIQARHSDDLLRKPHVVGVGIGMRCRRGKFTDEMCLVVMVDEKLKPEDLNDDERIPGEIEGVPVDVQETGVFNAL